MADTALATQNETLPVGDAFVSMIERAAVNPNVDPEKLLKLYELHEKVQANEARQAFYAAMSAMQPNLPVVSHSASIGYEDRDGNWVEKGSYTPWEDIDEQIRPIYTEHGFSLTFRLKQQPNAPLEITAIVMHRMGHSEQTTICLPPDPSGKKNNVQAVGSAITYGKRYAACAALNVTTRGAKSDDDDGERAGQPMTPHTAKKHELWERLEGELKKDCTTRPEAKAWYERTKQYRTEWHAMPKWWRELFFNELLLPFIEDLPEVRD